MPWKASKPMDERLKFLARVLDGEQMAGLCRVLGISRKTGYKILRRYNDSGLEAFTDRSRRPYRQADQLPFQIEALVVRLKGDKPHWGAPKIRERLKRLAGRWSDVTEEIEIFRLPPDTSCWCFQPKDQ